MQIFYAGINLTKLIQEKYYKEPYKSDKINEISRDFPCEKQNIDNLDIDKEIIKFFTNLSFDEIKDTKTNYRIEPDEILKIARSSKYCKRAFCRSKGLLMLSSQQKRPTMFFYLILILTYQKC